MPFATGCYGHELKRKDITGLRLMIDTKWLFLVEFNQLESVKIQFKTSV